MADTKRKGNGIQKQSEHQNETITNQKLIEKLIEKYCNEVGKRIQRYINALGRITNEMLLEENNTKSDATNFDKIFNLILSYIPKVKFFKDAIMFSLGVIKEKYRPNEADSYADFYGALDDSLSYYLDDLDEYNPGFDLIGKLRENGIDNNQFYKEINETVSRMPDYDEIRRIFLSSYIYSTNTADDNESINKGYIQIRIKRTVNHIGEIFSYIGNPEVIGVDYQKGTHEQLKDLFGSEESLLRMPFEVRIHIQSVSMGGTYNFKEFIPVQAIKKSSHKSELETSINYEVIQGSTNVFNRWAKDGSTVPLIKDLN
jgi:hypothetical protein